MTTAARRQASDNWVQPEYSAAATAPDDAIVITGLTKSFKKVRVLEGIDITVKRGKMLALLGPNGAGKTTIVRILATLLIPDGGSVMVGGFDVVSDAKSVRSIIGLTGQYAAVDELLSGRKNLEMMGRLYHLSKAVSQRRAEELLAQFDLEDAAGRMVKTYSGGMRRRLDLAASLVAVPPIVFLDEPTTGLDPRSRLAMWDVIEKLMVGGVTILLTTQYLDEADKLADRIAVLDRGKIIAEGTGDELKARVGSERLEMVIAPGNDFAAAQRIVGAFGMGLQSSEGERSLSVATDGSVRAIKQVLDPLYDAGIELERMVVQKPTLDDVFLQLTGHETGGRPAGAGEAHASLA
ncbi:MAG TPA: ATP-binding cassette domain-containing protein [Trueperaceae bacterium]|nr:ATP-binding cassette domain-containing protein [Trueperaceae bacterium]